MAYKGSLEGLKPILWERGGKKRNAEVRVVIARETLPLSRAIPAIEENGQEEKPALRSSCVGEGSSFQPDGGQKVGVTGLRKGAIPKKSFLKGQVKRVKSRE